MPQPPEVDIGPRDSGEPPGEPRPDRIGPYRILEWLGEGGMGVVYLAEQTEPVRRRVALKVVRAGLRSREVLARFEGERQALARMSHSGIATVFDAGQADDGRPYFVMEYVDGPAITEYCNRRSLGLRDRLELLIEVCDAVHHAHQNAVIHRDLTPHNILVAENDGKPSPRIIDFGVAKSLDDPLTQRTYFTHHHALIGKPAYMPPEQAGQAPGQANATADIYSLGIVLYELLTGVLPFDEADYAAASQTGYVELVRMIREAEPPRPSERVRRLRRDGTKGAATHGLSSAAWVRALRNELDWICMRAIDKNPARRYRSAAELGDDLRRFLEGRAVQAGPPTTWYRLKKSIGRHRLAAGATAMVAASLIAGFVATATMFVRAEQQRRTAIRQGYLANIRAASASLREGEVKEAKRWLTACDSTMRGWEWDHLWRRTDASVYAIRAGERRVVWAGFAPDGRRFATTSADGHVRLWSWGRGAPRLERVWQMPSGGLCLARFSPDGKRLAIGSIDSTVRVWDLVHPAPGPAWRGGFVAVLSLAWSHDGTRIAVSSDAPRVVVLDAGRGGQVATLDLPGIGASSVLFQRNGRLLVGRQDGPVQEFDVGSRKPVRTLVGHEGSVIEMALHPRAPRLATVSTDQTIRIWDLNRSTATAVLRDHKGNVNGVSFRPDGRRFATGSYDKTVRIWDAENLRCVRVLRGHEGYIYPVAYSPDGRFIVSGSDDEMARIWDPLAPENPEVLAAPSLMTEVVALEAGRYVTADVSGSLHLWRAGEARPSRSMPAHEGPVLDLACSADGRLVATVGGDGMVRTWSPALDSLDRIRVDPSNPYSVAVRPDGRAVAVGLEDGGVGEWELGTSSLRRVARHQSVVQGVAYSPDGRQLASGSWASGLIVRDSATGDTTGSGPIRPGIMRLAFSADGRRVFAGSWFGRILVLDAARCTLMTELGGHNSVAHSIVFGPRGLRFATASQDRTVRLWDAETGDPLLVLEGHEASVGDVAFAPDDGTIYTVSEDRTIRIWRR